MLKENSEIMRKPITLLILIMAHVPLLITGKRNRHNRDNRESVKKPDKGHCASDFCLPNNYNSLELPSSDKQIVAINLEVSIVLWPREVFLWTFSKNFLLSCIFSADCTESFFQNSLMIQRARDTFHGFLDVIKKLSNRTDTVAIFSYKNSDL